jgi:transcriptional regulator with XRE-family HTH domain
VRGERLREARLQKGLSMERLAEQLNLGTRQIHRYESGITKPSSDTVAALALLLGVSSDFLLGLTDDPRPCHHEDELSAQERKFISAWRRGRYLEALREIVRED